MKLLWYFFVVKTHRENKCEQGAGTDEHALIEILVTRSNEEILAMNDAYLEGECPPTPPPQKNHLVI